jgi:hypothetical protein
MRLRRCRFGACSRLAGHGETKLFCEDHADLLGRIREELEVEEGQKYRIWGTKPGYLATDQEDASAA